MRTRLKTVVQAAAELYVEAQVVERRRATDRRFTEAQYRAAVAELGRLSSSVAAQLRTLDAQKQNA